MSDTQALAASPPSSAAAPQAPPARPTLTQRLVAFLGYVAVGLAGAATALCWLDERCFPLAWLGIAYLVFSVSNLPAELAFRRGVVFGTTGVTLAFHWVPGVITHTLALSYLNCILLFMLFTVWDGFHWGLTLFLARRASSAYWPPAALYGVFWIALEFLWPRIFPWKLAHAQLGWLSLVQLGEFAGVYGVGFVVMWGGALLGQWAAWLVRRSPETLVRLRRESLVAGVVLLASLAFGTWRVQNIEAIAAQQPEVTLSLLQVDVFEPDALEQLQRMSQSVPPETDLICWPESSAGVYDLALTHFRDAEQIRALSRPDNEEAPPLRPLADPPAPLLCVGKSYPGDAAERGPYHVSAFLIDDHENILGRYHKRTLLPLGEYVPGDKWFPALGELALLYRTIQPGKDAGILELPGKARFGALICYEDMIAANGRQSTWEGAEVLVSLINGSAFGDSFAMRQHRQLAHFRAIENRRYLARCSSTGVTTVIAPSGKIVASLPQNVAQKLTVAVHPMSTTTVYTLVGDLFAYGCLILAAALLIRQWRTGRTGPT